MAGGLGALSCTRIWAPRHARASDVALSDRIDTLYSNQFHFNERGEPQVSVGLRHGRKTIRLQAPGGLRLLPSGDGGTEISAGETVEIRLGTAEPAEQSYAVVLEELTGSTAMRPGPAMQRWKQRGLEVHAEEVGTVFGVDGRVLDNRRTRIVTGRWSSESRALEAALQLKESHGGLGALHPKVIRRATGSMTAIDLASGVEVRAEGVLWLAPNKHVPLRLLEDDTSPTPEFWGQIYVAIDRTGRLSVVNLVSETDLLAGLVPAEIYASAPMQALEAQAVAARGQLVSKVGTRHTADPFLLCSDQHCQVYAGRHREHPRTTKAVRATAGLVAMRPGGTQLVDTVYSANSGGHTEDNEQVWPGDPDAQLRGRPDPLVPPKFRAGIDASNIDAWLRSPPRAYSRPDGDETPYRWTASLDPASIAGQPGVPESVGRVTALEILSRGRSGRANALRIRGKKTVELHGELRIRRALGGLRSSMFILDSPDRYGRFQLLGGGHGHGVGLCQHGAMGMAAAGKSLRQIVEQYYRGAELVQLW